MEGIDCVKISAGFRSQKHNFTTILINIYIIWQYYGNSCTWAHDVNDAQTVHHVPKRMSCEKSDCGANQEDTLFS